MLRQFEIDKERTNGESSSSQSSPSKSTDFSFYEHLSVLISERKILRLQMRELEIEQEKAIEHRDILLSKYKLLPNDDDYQQLNILAVNIKNLGSRYTHLKNEMQYLNEDINSIIAAASIGVNNKPINVNNDKNKEENMVEKYNS